MAGATDQGTPEATILGIQDTAADTAPGCESVGAVCRRPTVGLGFTLFVWVAVAMVIVTLGYAALRWMRRNTEGTLEEETT